MDDFQIFCFGAFVGPLVMTGVVLLVTGLVNYLYRTMTGSKKL